MLSFESHFINFVSAVLENNLRRLALSTPVRHQGFVPVVAYHIAPEHELMKVDIMELHLSFAADFEFTCCEIE